MRIKDDTMETGMKWVNRSAKVRQQRAQRKCRQVDRRDELRVQ